MFVIDSIGLANTALPLAVLAILAVLVPRFVVDRDTRSHVKLAVGILVSTLILLVAGFGLSVLLTKMRGFDVQAHVLAEPGAAFWLHARLSMMAAIVWAPILALIWFGAAQAVEARRGRDVVLGER